ncbi:hypothetical protein C1H76_5635 [Elsinoe australis]|uniref:Uncharacterized protein n=1 Tax=Elsinoe australis TaxID=40998 RepID=A0A4U7AVJ3_9PEZI|nr:hypothetical protein C1H76_5635 [Elsinoe australis]
MEYLISGKLESTAENRIFSCVTLEDLIKSGLTTLLPELKQIEPSLHLATEYQSMVNGLFRSTSLLNPKEIQVVEKISSLFDDHFKDAMRVALVALRRRCMDTSQDATLSRFLSQLGEYEDRVAKCKPSVTDALYPSQAGGSGVLDSDQIMIFWRSICQHSGHTRQTQDPNRGLETIQVNPAPPDSDDAGRSWLYVKPIYEGPVITGLEKINMDKIIGKMESEGEDVDRQQAPPSSLSEARSGSVDQDLVVKETNTATEPSDTLPSQVHPSKDFWVFGEGSYRNAIAVIQKHFDQVEKDRNKAINEAYKKTGGLLPMFGPGPLGLLDQTATSDEFGGMYKSLKRKRD